MGEVKLPIERDMWFRLASISWLLVVPVLLAPSSSLAGSAVVLDQGGRRIPVERPFRRIISLYGAHTVNLLELGVDRELVGITRADKTVEQLKSRPVFTYHDGPERFLAAAPDLVLIRPMIDRGYPNLVRKLEQTGVTVASLQPRSAEEMYEYWRALGLLIGKSREAEEMIARFKQGLEEISSVLSRMPAAKRKRVYFESIHSKMKTFSPSSIAIFCLEAAGGVNVATDAVTVRNTNIAEYGKERIMARADEIDVYLAQQGPMNRVTIDAIRAEGGFGVIKAVRTGRIHLVDEKMVSRPTPHLLKGIRSIARILYPEYFGPGGQ
ncbi:MAG: ABC transporter substrate-binding protein [Deltaproteobacteria bacterium]|nr:ABC transporter substrate-binding protein [Deltaproteobacteria bacterium]MBW2137399.1 ABC transporter substrate-binding protein [Deltaproteobacteria bacterium]